MIPGGPPTWPWHRRWQGLPDQRDVGKHGVCLTLNTVNRELPTESTRRSGNQDLDVAQGGFEWTHEKRVGCFPIIGCGFSSLKSRSTRVTVRLDNQRPFASWPARPPRPTLVKRGDWALPGHHVGEHEGGRRGRAATGRSPLVNIRTTMMGSQGPDPRPP